MTTTAKPTASPPGVALYRKRPVVLRAVQLVDDDACDWDEIAAWCGGRIYNVETAPGAEPETRIDVRTLEGTHTAMEGDWIVQGTAGEFWRVEGQMFPAYYEPAGSGGIATWTVTRLSLIGALRESLDGAALGLEGLGDLADAILGALEVCDYSDELAPASELVRGGGDV